MDNLRYLTSLIASNDNFSNACPPPVLQEQLFAYDSLARKTSVSLVNADQTAISVTDGSGGTTQSIVQYDYDNDNRPTCTAIRLTLSSLPSSACNPQSAPGTFGPDRVSKYSYDNASRPTGIAQGDGTTNITTKSLTYYAGNNLLKTVADGDGYSHTTTYAYDTLNHVQQQQWPASRAAGAASATSLTRQATYDNLGRVTSATANGQTISYTYNAFGEVVSETQPAGKVSYTYDLDGRRTTMSWPDGVIANYSYDVNRLVTIGIGSAIAGPFTTMAAFTYDNLDRRLTKTLGASKATTTYTYQGFLHTLKFAFAGTAADNETLTFTENPAGQIVSKTGTIAAFEPPAKSVSLTSYMPNALNEIATAGSLTLNYDGHGNETSNGTGSYSYDALDGLLTSPTGGSLAYDPIGRLLSATAAGSTSQFLYDGGHVIAEYNGATMTQRYVFGPGADEPLAWYTGTTAIKYLVADQRGSVIAVTNQTGTVQAINSYDDYGAPGANNMGRFQYTGQMWLPEVGLYNYKARLYDPALGRFLQTDPMGYGAGMNLYAYAGGDPINNTDPSGMTIWRWLIQYTYDLPDPTDPNHITTVGGNIEGSFDDGWNGATSGGGSGDKGGGGTNQTPPPCNPGAAKQYGVSFSGNIFLFFGGISGSLTLGVSIPDQGTGAQLYLGGEIDPMVGLGLNLGTAVGPTWGSSPSSMTAGVSGNETGAHAEGSAGLLYGAGMAQTTLPDGTVSTSIGLAGPPLPAAKAGAYVGFGPAYSGQISSSQIGCKK